MDLASLPDAIWNTALIKIVPFLFVLTVIVFFHELGHYLIGRWSGIKIMAFSIGFGPELVGVTDRHGTRWKLCAIPLGGYVKFFGDENAASMPSDAALRKASAEDRARAFQNASVGKRAATVASGPIANFILAIAIFAATAYASGIVVGDPIVSEVRPNSPAAVAGIQPGDRVTSADGERIRYFSDLQRYVSTRAGEPIQLGLERGGENKTISVTPDLQTQTDGFGNSYQVAVIGIVANSEQAAFRHENLSLVEALNYGVSQTWFVTERTVAFIGGIFRGAEKSDQIGGPIKIAQVSSQVATLGFAPLLNLAALLSISLGLLNLLPIPMLDGGHLLFYAFEAARGKPLSERVQEFGFRIGLALVMLLMVFAFWNDLSSLT